MLVTQVSNEYIDAAIEELTALLGVKESISPKAMLEPLHAGKIQECITAIANYLGLPVSIILTVTPQNLYGDKNRVNGVPTYSSQPTQTVAAQVFLPDRLPLYGSSALTGLPIKVQVSEECTKNPDTFVAVMAHELSHVVMHSLWHPQKHNEIYTDLAAMLLGFSEIVQIGRKTTDATQHYSTTTTTTTTYGYLSDESFAYAFHKVQQSLTEKRNLENDLRNQIMQQLSSYQEQIRDFKEKIVELEKLADYLDKHPNKRLAEKDAQTIVELHRVDRMDLLEAVKNKNLSKMEEMTEASVIWLRVTGHYTAQNADRLRDALRNIEYLIWALDKDLEKVETEIGLLKKYVGFWGRFGVNR
jgi:uncharacterized protein YeeX (DUF496 family)